MTPELEEPDYWLMCETSQFCGRDEDEWFILEWWDGEWVVYKSPRHSIYSDDSGPMPDCAICYPPDHDLRAQAPEPPWTCPNSCGHSREDHVCDGTETERKNCLRGCHGHDGSDGPCDCSVKVYPAQPEPQQPAAEPKAGHAFARCVGKAYRVCERDGAQHFVRAGCCRCGRPQSGHPVKENNDL